MIRRAPIILLTLLVAGDWPDWSVDAGRTRVASEPIGTSLSVAWSLSVGSRILASPVTGDGFVVFGTEDGRVIALRETDGAIQWTFTGADQVVATPLLRNGRVITASRDGTLRALRLADGSPVWTTSLVGSAMSSPKEAGGNLIVGTGAPRGAVRAVNPDTGATVWDTPIVESVFNSPAVDGATLWIGSSRGLYERLDVATGAPLASVVTNGNAMMSSPLIAFGETFVVPGGIDMGFRALGNWSVTLTDPFAPGAFSDVRLDGSAPMVAGPLVCTVARFAYFIDTNGNGIDDQFLVQEYAVGVNPATQSVAWQTLLGSVSSGSRNIIPTLGLVPTPVSTDAAARLIVGSSVDKKLRILDAAGGAIVSTLTTDAPGRSSPAVSNGRVIWGTDGGTLWSLQGSANSAPLPPAAGFDPPMGANFSMDVTSLSWGAGTDAEDAVAALRYVVRIDSDGEILEDWIQETVTAPGVTAVSLAPPASPTALYAWAVRTEDSAGARSAWSAPQFFTVGDAPMPPSGLTATPSISAVVLNWTAGPTPGVVGYNVRWTPGGGPLFVAGTSFVVPGLVNGTTYTFDVRAVDGDGDESVPVLATATPTDNGLVSVNGIPFGDLFAAMAVATPGARILVGRGTFVVPPNMTLDGMSLIGISPHDTWLDAGGLGTGLRLIADAANTPMVLSHFSFFGAVVGIEIQSGRVTVTHTVVRDMGNAGVYQSGPAVATIVNNTIVLNGDAAVDVQSGFAAVRNNILNKNGTGLRVVGPGTVQNSYNDLSENAALDLEGNVPGEGDFSAPVVFLDENARDFRVVADQPTTDAGDPADPFLMEPEDNGDRVNVGAYGNTPWAATTAIDVARRKNDRGCFGVMAAQAGGGAAAWLALAALLLAVRRRRG